MTGGDAEAAAAVRLADRARQHLGALGDFDKMRHTQTVAALYRTWTIASGAKTIGTCCSFAWTAKATISSSGSPASAIKWHRSSPRWAKGR